LSRSSSPSKGTRRRPLEPERIETTALDLIEREGLDAFSTRKLAQALGCEAMSIYHYYPSKAKLMDALLDRLIGTIPPPPDTDWIGKLRAASHAMRAMALAHPEFFRFMALHRMNTPTALRWLDGIIAIFRAAGLDEEATARLFRSLSYYVIGAALDEAAGYAKGPSAVEPVPPEQIPLNYPAVAAVGPFFQPAHHKRTFETGLEIMLEGIAKEAARQNAAPARAGRSARQVGRR
jgi:AcrR family transcriptional regulator